MSCSWKVSSTRPWPVSEDSASSATAEANAARSRMISSIVSRPTIERSAPASTSEVKVSMPCCWLRKRWAAARIELSVPPTLTIATPSRSHFTPCLDTAPRMPTGIRRLERSIVCSFWTTGSTKTLAPMTTFWPELSRETTPEALGDLPALPPGDQERLVGPGHLDPGQDEQDQQEDQDGDAADGVEQGHGVPPGSGRGWGGSGAVETTSTAVSLSASTT